jgi:DNA methylase
MSTVIKRSPPSTRGRGKTVPAKGPPSSNIFHEKGITLCYGDSAQYYAGWERPTAIISDGGYGVLGFEGDTSDHLGLPDWYESHIRAWSEYSMPSTTLWFWNSEIGWAVVHPLLEKYGWRYVECNTWNKTKAHIAGNVNTKRLRRFPVVTEICVLYVREMHIDGLLLKEWLLREWKRSGLPLKRANDACGVRDAAVRKYLDQGHLWYFPPPEKFERLVEYANMYGEATGRPYFSIDGKHPVKGDEWSTMRSKFNCPYGWTNVWERLPVHGSERLNVTNGKAAHLNQKPVDLMRLIIEASSDEGDVIWEPFGGLFSASLAAYQTKRKAYAGEIDPDYYALGVERLEAVLRQGEFSLSL